MPSAISNGARIRSNTPAENAFNALESANRSIATKQLRLSTGKRINTAADDVSGYITVRSLQSRNGSLKSALTSVGDASSVASIASDALDNIGNLLNQIKDSAASAASGSLGTDERVALAKSAYGLSQQIQSVVDSTVYGGKQLLAGAFSGEFIIGSSNTSTMITMGIDLTSGNVSQFNIGNAAGFEVQSSASNFAGVSGLSMASLNSVSSTNLGVFSVANIQQTLASLTTSIDNVSKVASYLGGVTNRLNSQEDLLKSQITNYNAAISRIEDADMAKEQLDLVKSQFLQQTSIVALSQANSSPQAFLSLLR